MKNEMKNESVQVGNYIISIETCDRSNVLCVKSVSGQWKISWTEDTENYAVIYGQMYDKNCHPYLEALLTIYYNVTSHAHDIVSIIERGTSPVLNGIAKLIQEGYDYEVLVHNKKSKISKEQDDKILDQTVQMENVLDEIGNTEAEEGDE